MTDAQMTAVRNQVQSPKTTVKQMGVVLADFISREAGRRFKGNDTKVDHAATVVLDLLRAATHDLSDRGLMPLALSLELEALVAADVEARARDGMMDNAKDTGWHDGKEESGAKPEGADERMGKELYDAAKAPPAGNVALAHNVGHSVRTLMEFAQATLRERFGLPGWNVMFECENMIGDTNGLAPPLTEDEVRRATDAGYDHWGRGGN